MDAHVFSAPALGSIMTVASVLRQAKRLTKVVPFAVVAGAAAFALPRLLKRRANRAGPRVLPLATAFADAGRRERQVAEILSLAAALVSTRDAGSDIERLECLRRAAAIVLETEPLISRFVDAQSDRFLRRCDTQSNFTAYDCHRCGATMVSATEYDASVEDWLPVWKCERCGASVTR